jgi:ribosomal protein S4
MRTRQFKKFSHNLLNQKIPENLLPITGLFSKKGEQKSLGKLTQKRFAVKKYRSNSNIGNQLYRSFAVPLIDNNHKLIKYLTPTALYSIDQINLELRKNRIQKSSDFGYHLQERKKLRWFYGGISTRSLRKIFKESYTRDATLASSVFQILEKRLDVVLYRSGFFTSIYEARQWILNKRILINDRLINRPSYQMQPGDIVTILEKCHALLAQNILERFLLFLKKVKLVESFNEKTFLNIKNIQLKEPLHFFRLNNSEEDKTIKDTKKFFKYFLSLQTSRRLQKQLTQSTTTFLPFHVMKSQHLEISFKTLSFIYLYPPQKIIFPTLLNMSAIEKSF